MIDIRLRLIIAQMVLGFFLIVRPEYPQQAIGMAIVSFGATGLFNNVFEIVQIIKKVKKESNDHPNN